MVGTGGRALPGGAAAGHDRGRWGRVGGRGNHLSGPGLSVSSRQVVTPSSAQGSKACRRAVLLACSSCRRRVFRLLQAGCDSLVRSGLQSLPPGCAACLLLLPPPGVPSAPAPAIPPCTSPPPGIPPRSLSGLPRSAAAARPAQTRDG